MARRVALWTLDSPANGLALTRSRRWGGKGEVKRGKMGESGGKVGKMVGKKQEKICGYTQEKY